MLTKTPNDSTAEKAGSAENGDHTIVHGAMAQVRHLTAGDRGGRSKRSNILIDGGLLNSVRLTERTGLLRPLDSRCARARNTGPA